MCISYTFATYVTINKICYFLLMCLKKLHNAINLCILFHNLLFKKTQTFILRSIHVDWSIELSFYTSFCLAVCVYISFLLLFKFIPKFIHTSICYFLGCFKICTITVNAVKVLEIVFPYESFAYAVSTVVRYILKNWIVGF